MTSIKTRIFGVSLRARIVLLLAGALSIGLLSYVYVGTSLVVDDKTSYVYDQGFARIEAAAAALENRLSRVTLRLGALAPRLGAGAEQADRDAAESAWRSALEKEGVSALLILRPRSNLVMLETGAAGGGAPALREALRELRWDPQAFSQSALLARGLPGSGSESVVLGVRGFDSADQAFAAVAAIPLKAEEAAAGAPQIQLFDTLSGTRVFPKTGAFSGDDEKLLTASLQQKGFQDGMRDARVGGTDYIASYKTVAGGQLTLVGLLPRELAFGSVRTLFTRSLAFGAGILAIALALTILFVRGLAARLRALGSVTRRVADGDFTARVDTTRVSNDELGGLALSFNAMADKIDELKAQTAEKARMAKEMETAHLVQSRYFPERSYDEGGLGVGGWCQTSGECGGDWWGYARCGDKLLVAIGDVSAQGVSAALVTAAAHSAFAAAVRAHGRDAGQIAPERIIGRLNTAVRAAAGGVTGMSFCLSVIDLRSGVMELVNAGHRPPYRFRKGDPEGELQALAGGDAAALGLSDTLASSPARVQLKPGDLLLWYTDGILAELESAGLTRIFSSVCALPSRNPDELSQAVLKACREHWGASSAHRPDDVTAVVGVIPETGFMTGTGSAA